MLDPWPEPIPRGWLHRRKFGYTEALDLDVLTHTGNVEPPLERGAVVVGEVQISRLYVGTDLAHHSIAASHAQQEMALWLRPVQLTLLS